MSMNFIKLVFGFAMVQISKVLLYNVEITSNVSNSYCTCVSPLIIEKREAIGLRLLDH